MKLYSVYDKTAKEFAQPFVAVNDDVAVRNFRDSCSRLSDLVVQDLWLYYVGYFDEKDGELVSGDLDRLFDGADLLKVGEENADTNKVLQP